MRSQLVKLLEGIKNEDTASLEAMILMGERHSRSQWAHTPRTVVEDHISLAKEEYKRNHIPHLRSPGRLFDEEDIYTLAGLALQRSVEKQIAGVHPCYGDGRYFFRQLDDVRDFDALPVTGYIAPPAHKLPDLLSAIYMHFFIATSSSMSVRHCEYCGKPFEPKRRDQRFCPGGSCRSAARNYRRPAWGRDSAEIEREFNELIEKKVEERLQHRDGD